jgi:hypothetical protein
MSDVFNKQTTFLLAESCSPQASKVDSKIGKLDNQDDVVTGVIGVVIVLPG